MRTMKTKETYLRILFVVLLACMATICHAKDNEPGNNLGKTLSQLQQVFPHVRYERTESKGDFYSDGEDSSEGITCFFYLKNNRVVEEGMVVMSDDGFPKMVYDSWIKSFSKYMRYAAFGCGANHMCFSNFTMHIMYFPGQQQNTALLLYRAGGVNNGLTYNEFINLWSN